jgi:hypothetical protein
MSEVLDISYDDDEQVTVFTDGQPPVKLPPVRRPRRTAVQTSDPTLRICVHELARALEEYARKQYVPLFGTESEFEVAAEEIARLMHADGQRCPLKH